MATKTDTTPKEAVMYIGPTKMGALHVTNGSVFKDGILPDHLVKVLKGKGVEEFKSLFVPISLAGKSRAALREAGSELSKAFLAVKSMEV